MSKFFQGHYNGWNESRFEGVLKYVDKEYFKGKSLYELGCGYGYNGQAFKNAGCDVTASDSRIEHIENARLLHPEIEYELFDCDNDSMAKKYDIVLHWGVLYHLNPLSIESHISNVCSNCDVLFLETEVCDNDDDDNLLLTTLEKGYDQAFNGVGSRPCQRYIERLLSSNGFKYEMIKDGILNHGFHKYDWESKKTDGWYHGLRRYWICWNANVRSPLKTPS